MRVLFAASGVALSLVVVLAGCSSGSDDTILRGSPSAPARSATPTKTPSGSAPASSSIPPAPDTTTTDGGATPPSAPTTPSTPPVPGSCASPKCFGLAGIGGCKATGQDGALITMGCQDGACACLIGNQTTSTFDGDVATADDARQLFLTNCNCF